MNIEEYIGGRVTSVHYPTWVDYFDWGYMFEETDSDYKVHTYHIKKNQISDVNMEKNRIIFNMIYGQRVILSFGDISSRS